MSFPRQLVAVATASFAEQWRAGDSEPVRRAAVLLLRCIWLYLATQFLLGVAEAFTLTAMRTLPERVTTVAVTLDHLSACRVLLWSLVGVTAASRFAASRSRADERFLASLPISPHVFAARALLSGAPHLIVIAAFLGSAAQVGVLGVLAGAALYVVAACAGDMLAHSLVGHSRQWVGLLSLLRGLVFVGGTVVIATLGAVAYVRSAAGDQAPAELQPVLALWPLDSGGHDPMYHFVYMVLHTTRVWPLAAVGALAVLAYFARHVWLKRERPVQARPTGTTLVTNAFAFERLLESRAAPWIAREAMPVVTTVLVVGARFYYGRGLSLEVFETIISIVLVVSGSSSLRRARSAVRRDVRARPLLASLPMAPSSTLQAKTALVQAHAVSYALGPLVLAGTATHVARLPLVLLCVGLVFALVTLGSLAVSISFFSEGDGAGVSRLERSLVFLPLLGFTLPVAPLGRVVSLLALAALAFEARRSALRSLRFSDDPTQQRETETWRALLVLGVFFQAQLVVGLITAHVVKGSWSIAVAYATAGAVLALLSINIARERVLLWPRGVGAILLALPVGLLIGQAVRLGPVSADLPLAITVCVFAPIVEEFYFRGVLQRAIERELPRQFVWGGSVIAAFAFSMVHIGGQHVPIFVVGLICGVFARASGGLIPAMVVHAGYNTAVMFGVLP